jgi:hypothetical protein
MLGPPVDSGNASTPIYRSLDKEGSAMRPRLRIFTGEECGSAVAEPQVNVRLGQIVDILADAVRSNRSWLSDFEDDEIQVSSDLYDVICSYRNLRPSA